MSRVFLKDLYAELESAKQRKHTALRAWLSDPEYRKLSNQLDALAKKLQGQSKAQVDAIDAEIRDLQRQIVDTRDSRDKLTLDKWPEWLREFIKEISYGVDWGAGHPGGSRWWMLRWMSKDERFVIITRPGGDFWHGVGLKSYGPVYHWLVDRARFEVWQRSGKGRKGIGAGMTLAKECTVIEHEGGRLSAFRRAQMIEKAKEIAA